VATPKAGPKPESRGGPAGTPAGLGRGGSRFEFFVAGRPVPWMRARTKRGQFFKPEKMRTWQDKIAWTCRQAMTETGWELKLGTVKLTVLVYRTRRGLRAGDGSNYYKAAEDALNRVAYADDGQIVEGLWRLVRPPWDNGEGLRLIVEEAT
jgi:Holliday junction resolvase RusA-like endonuclease